MLSNDHSETSSQKKQRGHPKVVDISATNAVPEVMKKGRGRPKGSKNKNSAQKTSRTTEEEIIFICNKFPEEWR